MGGTQVVNSLCWRVSPPSWGRESCILSLSTCWQLFIAVKEMRTIQRENTWEMIFQCSELAAATSPWSKVRHLSCKRLLSGVKPLYPELAFLSPLCLGWELAGKKVCLASGSRAVYLWAKEWRQVSLAQREVRFEVPFPWGSHQRALHLAPQLLWEPWLSYSRDWTLN